VSSILPSGYSLRQGSGLDRALLLKFLQRTYAEQANAGDYAHLAETVDQYLSQATPLWWVEPVEAAPQQIASPIACLWLGTAIDQVSGDRHTHVFLLYVAPEHRRRGIGTALMHHAETLARTRGDRQIGLQVFQSNQPAVDLYHHLGFETQSLWMVKRLDGSPTPPFLPIKVED